MKKFLLSAAFAFAAIAAGFAQTVTKPVVNVQTFSYSTAFGTAEVEIIRNNVITNLQQTGRIIVVDLEQQGAVNDEAERRKDEAAMADDHVVAEITQLNANALLKGMLNTIKTKETQHKHKDGRVTNGWKTELEYTLQLIDPATGATIISKTLTSSASSSKSATESRQKAVAETSYNYLKDFVEEAFPVRGIILAAKDVDAKKHVAKTVFINLGTDQGIQSGQKFSVFTVVDIAGELAETEIGTITASEVLSATRTLCKVNKGADVITKKLEAKEELTIKTREARTFLDKL